MDARDLGLDAASGGLATARALSFRAAGTVQLREADDLRFLFVIEGSGSLQGAASATLMARDAVALPPGPVLLAGAPGMQVLEVTSPARVGTPTVAR